MQWFNTQDKKFKEHMTWKHIFQAWTFQDNNSCSNLTMVH
jgi:hypothetical protein